MGFSEVVEQIVDDSPIAMDLETCGETKEDGLNPWTGEIRLVALKVSKNQPCLIDLKSRSQDLSAFRQQFEKREVIGHNLRFDGLWLAIKFAILLRIPFDTYAAARILSNGDRAIRNELGSVLERYLGVSLPKDQGKSDWGGMFLTEEQLQYAANDVRYLHKLRIRLASELGSHGLNKTFELEMELLPVVIEMERAGFGVDKDAFELIIDKAKAAAQIRKQALVTHFGGVNFNFDSPEQLKAAFGKIGMDLSDTSEETLRGLDHPAANSLLEYRSVEMQRRQAESLLGKIVKDDRIHGEFLPLGTETGRFSSRNPNLQNISRGELRNCFVPAGDDRRLIIADYSQIELRAAAWFAKDEVMLGALRAKKDLHAQTASVVLGKPVAQISKQDRQLAKAVNFGLLYGQGARGLVNYAKTTYGISLSEARAAEIRKRFFGHYRGLADWHQTAQDNAPRLTEGRTIIGRRRILPENSSNWDKFQAQTNFAVQGSCADGLKKAMVSLAKQLPKAAQIVATVHDELIVECSQNDAEEVKKLTESAMKHEMESLFPNLPVQVDARICRSWGDK